MAINKEEILFITPYFKNGSLGEYINGKKLVSEATDEMKLKFIL